MGESLHIYIDNEKQGKMGKKLKLVEMTKKANAEPYAFLRYLESLELDGPSDFSKNLDEYLYGGKSLKAEE